jgi:hypothetical protein
MAFLLPLLGEGAGAAGAAGAAEGATAAAGASEAGAAGAAEGEASGSSLNPAQFAGKGGGAEEKNHGVPQVPSSLGGIEDMVKAPFKSVTDTFKSLGDSTNSLTNQDIGGMVGKVSALSHDQFGG